MKNHLDWVLPVVVGSIVAIVIVSAMVQVYKIGNMPKQRQDFIVQCIEDGGKVTERFKSSEVTCIKG